MRIMYASLSVAAALLLIGWAAPSPAGLQNCCHGCDEKTARSRTNRVVRVPAMSPVTTDGVRREFNASSDKVRIVALLSPACPGCQSGHAVVGRVLKKFSSPELQAILVWEPMRSDDSPTVATEQAEKVHDARIWQGWNGNKDVGNLFGKTLELHATAWDVYLLYKPGIKWEGREPPAPTFWMHQLQGVNRKLLLCADPTRLSAEVGKLLDHGAEVSHGD
jgi:hypothetical protein